MTDTLCWGIKKNIDGSFTVSAEYIYWLGSYLDESCNCSPHIDHADCISEAQAFVNLAKKLRGQTLIG